jgi:uncharacterized caspase-like protein
MRRDGMSRFRKVLWFLLMFSVVFGGGPALAEKRVALVIGNSSYEKVAPLGNPANDAGLMAETFKAAGFDSVDLRRNLNVADMRRALREFFYKSEGADIAVVFYAGHGIEVDGTNYLIPIDAVLARDIDIYDEALPLDRVLVSVDPAKQLRLVILDACRDNPFARTMKRTLSSRGISRGLAKVEPTSTNTLIAFAARAGSTASDGDDRNSPFTTALTRYITRPGLDLRKAFGYVRDDVLKATGNGQEPYVYGSLGGDDVPLVPARPDLTVPQADPQAAVRRDYELALQLGTRDGWQAFLSHYPQGYYSDLAKGQLNKIAAEEARAAAAEKVRLAEQEMTRLAAERAEKAEQERAVSAAKAAEEARVAAEKAKQAEQDKAAAAEQARVEAERAAAKAAAEKSAAEKAVAENAARQTIDNKKTEAVVAALPNVEERDPGTPDLARALQTELRRVGCNAGDVDGNWTKASQKALDLFNKNAGMKLDVRTASADALDAVKARAGRICPLICDTGYRADGDRCIKIGCRAGYEPNAKGGCERIEVKKPAAKLDVSKPRATPAESSEADAPRANSQASGQILCGQGGCRPVRSGCHLGKAPIGMAGSQIMASGQVELCP